MGKGSKAKTFVRAGKEHFRGPPAPRSPSTVSLSWSKLLKSESYENRLKMLAIAQSSLDELRDRVAAQHVEAEAAARARGGRQTTLTSIVAPPRAQSQAGPSGSKKTLRTQRGVVQRPTFEAQRLSPRLNPAVGGSGSKSSHSISIGDSPIRPFPQPSP